MGTKADEIAVGQAFIGTVWTDDLKKHPHSKVPGELVTVVIILPYQDEEFERLLMNVMATQPRTEPSQITCSGAIWVCGRREKRSRFVKLDAVRYPDPKKEEGGQA